MSNDDTGFSQDDAHVVNNDFSQPYARRSVGAVFLFSILAVIILLFAGWYFFDYGESETNIVYSQEQLAGQAPGNPHAPDSGRSAVYNFFYNVFEGINDAVGGANPDNLDAGVDIPATGGMSDQEALVALEQFYRQFDGQDSNTQTQSAFDVLGSSVLNEGGQKVAHLYDIIIDKSSGQAQRFVLDRNTAEDQGNDPDLVVMPFAQINMPVSDEIMAFGLEMTDFQNAPDFTYENDFNAQDTISLLYLRNADIQDYQGNIIGQVDTVLFENAGAQTIYFSLTSPVGTDIPAQEFMISYNALDVVQVPDGYDLKLSRVQSLHLVERLFPTEPDTQNDN